MTIRIETGADGKDVIWSEVGGKAVGLPAENIYIQVVSGHVFTTPPGSFRGKVMARVTPHEVEMVEHYLRETDGPHAPNVFAGESDPLASQSAL